METVCEDLKNYMKKTDEDTKKIVCYAICDLIKDSIKCLLDSLRCCFCKVRIERIIFYVMINNKRYIYI